MPTLQQLMDGDDNSEALNKTASAVDDTTVTDEIEKLALEIGVPGSPAAEQNLNQSHTKEANVKGLENVYNEMFPGDTIKVASAVETPLSKEAQEAAATEEAMGKHAYDAFQVKVDEIITKMAEEKVASGGAIDAEPVQALENNRGGTEKIPSNKVQTDNELPAENGPAVVGQEQQKHAAFKKALLLNQINKA